MKVRKAPRTGGRNTDIGLGWHLGHLDGEPFACHLGGGGGFRSKLRIYPRLGDSVAVLVNEFPHQAVPRLIVR